MPKAGSHWGEPAFGVYGALRVRIVHVSDGESLGIRVSGLAALDNHEC